MSEERLNRTVVAGSVMLVAGGLLGAAVALLFAPQSGKKTRRDITRYSRKIRRQAEDVVEEFAGTVHGMVENVGERAEEILEKGKDLAQDARKDLLKVIDEGQAALEKQKARLSKLIG